MSKAIIAAITAVQEIPGADKIQVAFVLGEQVIVSKDAQVGDVGVFFPVDTQLSAEYCHENNLNRHGTENKNPEKTGFFDANRRVRAQPFLKVKSQGYFADVKSLAYCVPDCDQSIYPLGYTFDEVEGKPICNKYISQATKDAIAKAAKSGAKLKKVPSTPYFDKHVDSAQFKHNAQLIPKGALIHFHAKVHGTSHRSGLTLVQLPLAPWKEWINKYVPIFPTEKWDYVVGTRNVVLQPGKEGFHGSEQYRFHVYRVTTLNHTGVNVDYSEAQLEQWCAERGLNGPVNVAPPFIYSGDVEGLMQFVEYLTENIVNPSADYIDPSHPGEGIILRIDTGKANPYFLKSKAHNFRVLEGMCEAVDMEDVEALS